MSFSETTTVYTMIAPQDRAEIEASLPLVMTPVPRPGTFFAFEVYAATHPSFWAGLRALYLQHVPVVGILDASQEASATERALVLSFFADFPGAKNDIAIGSMPGHNIVHLKGLFNNVPSSDSAVTPPPSPDWRTSVLNGSPTAWTGSWNMSQRADAQANNVDVICSRPRCAAFAQSIIQNKGTLVSTPEGRVDWLLSAYHDGYSTPSRRHTPTYRT